MNKELVEALNALEKEKEISKETLFEAIENSLITACKNHFGKADNVKVEINIVYIAFCFYPLNGSVGMKSRSKTVSSPAARTTLGSSRLRNSALPSVTPFSMAHMTATA